MAAFSNYMEDAITAWINGTALSTPALSWTLNEDTCLWDSPVPYPTDGIMYTWNEDILNWEEINLTQ